jgi:nitroimidazol reductase NimA-like FMN-containing flavoprotein (pyridoxamine 5'-phosphate oxidase superfamily)
MQRECNKPEVNDQSWKEFKKTEVDHEQENFVKACDEKSVEI